MPLTSASSARSARPGACPASPRGSALHAQQGAAGRPGPPPPTSASCGLRLPAPLPAPLLTGNTALLWLSSARSQTHISLLRKPLGELVVSISAPLGAALAPSVEPSQGPVGLTADPGPGTGTCPQAGCRLRGVPANEDRRRDLPRARCARQGGRGDRTFRCAGRVCRPQIRNARGPRARAATPDTLRFSR